MFNGFVLFLGSIGLALIWSLLNFSSPNFKEKVRKEGKKFGILALGVNYLLQVVYFL